MAAERVLIELILGEPVLRRHHLCAGELAELDAWVACAHRGAGRLTESVLLPATAVDSPIGTRLMLSTPAAMTTSIAPDITACAAK